MRCCHDRMPSILHQCPTKLPVLLHALDLPPQQTHATHRGPLIPQSAAHTLKHSVMGCWLGWGSMAGMAPGSEPGGRSHMSESPLRHDPSSTADWLLRRGRPDGARLSAEPMGLGGIICMGMPGCPGLHGDQAWRSVLTMHNYACKGNSLCSTFQCSTMHVLIRATQLGFQCMTWQPINVLGSDNECTNGH